MQKKYFIFDEDVKSVDYIYFYDLNCNYDEFHESEIINRIHHIIHVKNGEIKIRVIQKTYANNIIQYEIYMNYNPAAIVKEYINRHRSRFIVTKNNSKFEDWELIKFIRWLIDNVYNRTPDKQYKIEF